jgi:uncharacterized protein (DUF1684 family)
MRKVIFIFFSIFLIACSSPSQYVSTIEVEQVRRNAVMVNPSETPLDSIELTTFKGIFFFPIDEKYKVKATLTSLTNMPVFDMPHTLDRTYKYQKFGEVTFTLNEKIFTLPIYTNDELKKQKLLFLSFTDNTNGKETYGGGRYIDLHYNGTETELEIDFNRCYFPYCAYSHRFSCPIVPKENHLEIAVKAGEKFQ